MRSADEKWSFLSYLKMAPTERALALLRYAFRYCANSLSVSPALPRPESLVAGGVGGGYHESSFSSPPDAGVAWYSSVHIPVCPLPSLIVFVPVRNSPKCALPRLPSARLGGRRGRPCCALVGDNRIGGNTPLGNKIIGLKCSKKRIENKKPLSLAERQGAEPVNVGQRGHRLARSSVGSGLQSWIG